MASVGNMLKREREKQKLQISDISASTKIPEKFLRAIEKEDYSVFPAETFLVGFIRNYARELDLDPNEVVSLYKNTKLDKERTITTTPASSYVSKEATVKQGNTKVKRPVPQEEEIVETPPSMQQAVSKENLKKLLGNAGQKKDFLSEGLNFLRFFFRNQITVLITAGSFLFIILLVVVLFSVRGCSSKNSDQDRDTASMQVLQLDQMAGVFDLNMSEYYKLKLGRDFHTVMGEMQNKADAINNPQSVVKVLFRLGDDMFELSQSIKQDIDVDLDGTMDISLRLNSISEKSFNLSIMKLREFSTNLQTMEQTQSTQAVQVSRPGADPKKEAFTSVGVKKKIVFTAEVVRDRSYIKAWIDSQEQEGKMLYINQKVEYTAQDIIQLRIGNAGAMKVTINGIPYNLGRSTVTKTIRWKRDLLDENVYNLVIADWQ